MSLPILPSRFPLLSVALVTLAGADVAATRLMPESVAAWGVYTTATEQRITRELSPQDRFLALDFGADAANARAAVLAGQVVIQPMVTREARGHEIDMPSALIQHWRAAIFIPGATVDRVMGTLAVEAPPPGRDDVDRGGGRAHAGRTPPGRRGFGAIAAPPVRRGHSHR